MNLTVKFTNEYSAVTMEVQRLNCDKGRIVLHYMVDKFPEKFSESMEKVERLFLEAGGARGSMKVSEQEPSTFENVRTLTITKDSLVIEEMVDRMANLHQAEPKQLETLEIS